MTSKERILAIFKDQPVDKVPIHNIGFSSYSASLVLGREAYVGGGIQQWREAQALWKGKDAHQEFLERSEKDAFDISMAFNHDIIRLVYWRMPEKPTKKIDEYTFLYGDPETNWRIMRFDPATELYQEIERYPPRFEESLETIAKIVEDLERSIEGYPEPIAVNSEAKRLNDKYKDWIVRINCGAISIPYGKAWFEAIALRKDLIARYLDVQTEIACRNIRALVGTGTELIFGGGDFASNSGPFYSPKDFHELMLPRLKRITDECHKNGMYYLFASDGNLWPVADDLFGASGVDGFYEIDRKAGMDLEILREKFPHLVLIGNISSSTMHKGSKEEVIEEILSCVESAKKLGKIIIGCSNYIMPGTPEANIWAMIEVFNQLRS